MGLGLAKLRRFAADESGIALILVAILLPVIIGFALLVIDISRAENLQNDTQRGADALALAAAAELDGKSDAWTRAERALQNLVTNTTRFSGATGSDVVTLPGTFTVTANPSANACRSTANLKWCFLKSLPASDATTIDSSTGVDGNGTDRKAANAAETRFIQVVVKPQSFTTIFPASFIRAGNTMSIGSEAVAGFKESICDITPMFMCNPFETIDASTNLSFQQAFAQGKTYSRLFKLLKVDPNPGPGNFGLLETDLPLRQAFATGKAGTCYLRSSVETKTGVTLGHVNTGLNVRFDIYSGSMKQYDTNADYRPALNVRKGAKTPVNCNKYAADDKGNAMGFPDGDDTYSTTYTAQSSLGMSGDGWNRSAYWTLNHSAALPTIPSSSNPMSSTAPPSRYDVYRYEIDHNLIGDKAGGKNNGETGIPQCYDGSTSDITDSPDRRLFNIAVVDCKAEATKINGHMELSPDAYARVFLTNPVAKVNKDDDDDSESASEKPVQLEIVDVEGPSGNGTLDNFFRDEVELYR